MIQLAGEMTRIRSKERNASCTPVSAWIGPSIGTYVVETRGCCCDGIWILEVHSYFSCSGEVYTYRAGWIILERFR